MCHRQYFPKPRAFVVLVGLIAFLCCQPYATAQQRSDLLTSRPLPKTKPTPAVKIGSAIKTTAGQRRRLPLPDGAVLFVNENTHVQLKAANQLALSRGEVYLDRTKAKKDFEVITPWRRLTTQQSRFAVRIDRRGAGVLVTQGQVAVSDVARPIIVGHQLLPGSQKMQAAPRASHLLHWTRDLMAAAEPRLLPANQFAGGALIATDPNGQDSKLTLRKYHIDVHIEDGFARTTIDQTYFNHENFQLEGTFYFPLPPDASLSRLAMYVDGKLMEGGMVERNRGRDVYEEIRYTNRDPALLEWVDGSTFKMRVFPIEARKEKRILLSYSQKLPMLHGRMAYRFPSGHSLPAVRQWSFACRVKGGAKMTWGSPSHELKESRKNGDLLLHGERSDALFKKDVVLEVDDPAKAKKVRFAETVHEGQRYLLIRARPDLLRPAKDAKRQVGAGPRHWQFLFEASGDRDPLLARVQIEVIRHLLLHAEAHDTFNITSANTGVRHLNKDPRPVTPENIESAITWLEGQHLIGALDLNQALTGLPFRANTTVVHVGSGIPAMGERRLDVLAKRIPKTTRYIGVGVGRRWNRSLMKATAGRTGGYFTQINPDESIAWRAFDLLSTVQTLGPAHLRQVEITGCVPKLAGKNPPRFLHFNKLLTEGEELGAVLRLPADATLPKAVRLRFADGQTMDLPVRDVVKKADYLPRQWAKLEIDRLLKENAVKHKQRIIDLSKAMYVMTPYTSLLVLENEDMYKQFNVDRGRKDHWALYPAPAKVNVKHEPDPNAGVIKGRKKADELLESILVQRRPNLLASMAHIMGRGSFYDIATEVQGAATGSLMADLKPIVQDNMLRVIVPQVTRSYARRIGLDVRSLPELGLFVVPEPGKKRRVMDADSRQDQGLIIGNKIMDGRVIRRSVSVHGVSPKLVEQAVRVLNYERMEDLIFQSEDYRQMKNEWRRFWFMETPSHLTYERVHGGIGPNEPAGDFGMPLLRNITDTKVVHTKTAIGRVGTISDQTYRKIIHEIYTNSWGHLPERERRQRLNELTQQLSLQQRQAVHWNFRRLSGKTNRGTSKTVSAFLYHRPEYSHDLGIFHNLLAYAPGMNTTTADMLTVLDQEAIQYRRTKIGTIDAGARALIDKARSHGWQKLTVQNKKGDAVFTVEFDGQGRFAYEDTLSPGLREHVVCDGKTMLHLYPQLGLGARRQVSRFHRSEVVSSLPWLVLPVEELARDADVKLVGKRTVAIVPHVVWPKDIKEEDKISYQLRLVFGNDGQVLERQLVGMPKAEVVLRQVSTAGGVIKLIDQKGKEHVVLRGVLTPARQPDLSVLSRIEGNFLETKGQQSLVVLDLPYRSRAHLLKEMKAEKRRHAQLRIAQAVPLLASYVAAGDSNNARDLFRRALARRNQHHLGFYVLLAAAGVSLDAQSQNVLEEHPDAPLAQFLALHTSPVLRKHASQWAVNSVQWRDPFLKHLALTHALYQRWQSQQLKKWSPQRLAAERRNAFAYIRAHSDSEFGWVLLCLLQDQAGKDKAHYRELADLFQLFTKHDAFRYPARYEQARCLYHAGDIKEARRQFVKLYEDTLEAGALPAIDGDFRQVLLSDTKTWSDLLIKTADKLVKDKHRGALFTLARQCRQLDDTPMANQMIAAAFDGIKDETERFVMKLMAVQFYRETSQLPEAAELLDELLKDGKYGKAPTLWRMANQIADERSQSSQSMQYMERALDLEFQSLPDVVDLSNLREEYGQLLDHYDNLAQAMVALKIKPSVTFLNKVIRTADRWRGLDTDDTTVCNSTATILRRLGREDLAWDYATTPLAMQPNESGPWLNLARSMRLLGKRQLAELAYKAASEAEPTNAQIVWDRAKNLQQAGKTVSAQELYRHIAAGTWQPRFQGLVAQAKQRLR